MKNPKSVFGVEMGNEVHEVVEEEKLGHGGFGVQM